MALVSTFTVPFFSYSHLKNFQAGHVKKERVSAFSAV